jgi:hypothetical protein
MWWYAMLRLLLLRLQLLLVLFDVHFLDRMPLADLTNYRV